MPGTISRQRGRPPSVLPPLLLSSAASFVMFKILLLYRLLAVVVLLLMHVRGVVGLWVMGKIMGDRVHLQFFFHLSTLCLRLRLVLRLVLIVCQQRLLPLLRLVYVLLHLLPTLYFRNRYIERKSTNYYCRVKQPTTIR